MNTLKILIVDDEPGIRSGITRILQNYTVGFPFMDEDFSFDVIEAATGEEALELIHATTPDIILLDNKLPGIQGIEVLEEINKQKLDTAVMMITSYASLDIAVKATNFGAYNFVPKPFTPQELKSAIENISKHLFLKRMTRQMNKEGKQIRFQFLSVLSHELKSPLNAIEGYLKIMEERQVGNNLDDYQAMIDRSLIRIKGMRNLIMDLLDLTKLESGKKSRELKKVDICELARIAMDTIDPLAIQRNVKLHFDADSDIILTADPDEIEIILNNLLSNAVKYNKEGGKVDLNIRKRKDEVVFKVKDTGIGISEENKEKLFKEFSRIKNEQTRDITGSGLGLSITKRMVEQYHGHIEVESTPESGSTFTVTIPMMN
ncbi:MAG: hybrid sensor histidine kinase/response regulator [Bacteroidales bacterium]|jgi:signal transduction histidine kinase|nr:hybrid sensor histidine kinase/response regulator [Bacteroidales bacterium]